MDRVSLESRISALVGRPLFWALAVGVLFVAPFLRGLTAGRAPPPPPVLGSFPDFALRDDGGRPVASSDLRGHAFIANLLCVRCAEAGPLAAETMRKLQHRARNLGDALRLVSFSPDGDAAALSAIRRSHPSGQRWSLLVGAPDPVRALFPQERGMLLVDGELRIRGRYPDGGPAALDAILLDAALLLSR